MTKDELLAIVKANHDEQEDFYVNFGPDKHTQEHHYVEGVSVIGMNYHLLIDWLSEWADETAYTGEEAGQALADLPKDERREVWEASAFHFGIMGYDEKDADFWWENRAI